MKKLINLSIMLVVLVAMMAGAVSAATQVLNDGFYIPAPSNNFEVWTAGLNIGSGIWDLTCSGGTTLTATNAAATLTPSWADQTAKIWKFQISDDGASWTDVVFGVSDHGLVSGSGAGAPPATTVVGWQQGTKTAVSTSWIRIGYSATLVGANSNASGTAGMTATAVPEPSSAVALATGVVGIIGLLRRRRS